MESGASSAASRSGADSPTNRCMDMGASPNNGVNMEPASAEGGGTRALKKPMDGGPFVEGPCDDPKPNALSIADSGAFTSADTDS